MSYDNIASEFLSAMAAAGVPISGTVVADGKVHRVDVDGDKHGSRNGWYVLHIEDNSDFGAGAFGCWKRGVKETWHSKKSSGPANNEWREKLAKMKKEREEAEALIKLSAREKAQWVWKNSTPPPSDHPYLLKKKIRGTGLRAYRGMLVVPISEVTGELQSLQFISADGSKRFLTGGKIVDCIAYLPGEKPKAEVYVAEGLATGATIREVLGANVVIAFNAGNLPPVARALRARFPKIKIIICADNDRWTTEPMVNPGVTRAREAAKAVNATVFVPEFKDLSTRPTDFNDLFALEGPEAVKAQFSV